VVLSGPILGAMLAASCATSPQSAVDRRAGEAAITRPPSERWVLVSRRPPTWYPRGTSADCRTDFRGGEWIDAGRADGTRFFIPTRGLSTEIRMALRREALAARHPAKVAQIAAEDAARIGGQCAATLLALTPPGWLVCMAKHQVPIEGGGGIGGASISPGTLSGICGPGGVACCPGGVCAAP
jgi:hypothetical protein